MVFVVTVAAVWLAIWMGTLFGKRVRRKPDHPADTTLGTSVGATLGMLGFLLAFTFGITTEIFQTKRQLLLDEINAIGTTYLRACYLVEPHRSEICKQLREYVDIRVKLAKENIYQQPEKLREAVGRSEALQDEIWSHVIVIANADRGSMIDALFIDSLNNMIDLQTSRLTVGMYRIPRVIWNILYFITILSMVMVGYQIGLSGTRSLKVGFVLAIIFAAVVFLIVDLDRTAEGTIRLDQKPMFDLQKKMQIQIQ